MNPWLAGAGWALADAGWALAEAAAEGPPRPGPRAFQPRFWLAKFQFTMFQKASMNLARALR